MPDEHQGVLGVASKAYATRRYAEGLEKNRRDLVGDDLRGAHDAP